MNSSPFDEPLDPNMSCQDIRERLPLLSTDLLEPDEHYRIMLHLEGCAACRAHLARLQRMDHALQTMFAPTSVDTDDLLSVIPMFAESHLSPEPEEMSVSAMPEPTETRSASHIARWLAAIAAVLIVALLSQAITTHFRGSASRVAIHPEPSLTSTSLPTSTSTPRPTEVPGVVGTTIPELQNAVLTVSDIIADVHGPTIVIFSLTGTSLTGHEVLTDSFHNTYQLLNTGVESDYFSPPPAELDGKTLEFTLTETYDNGSYVYGNLQATFTTTVGQPHNTDKGITLTLDSATYIGGTYNLSGHTTSSLVGHPTPMAFIASNNNAGEYYNNYIVAAAPIEQGGVYFRTSFPLAGTSSVAQDRIVIYVTQMLLVDSSYPHGQTIVYGQWDAVISVTK